VIAHLEGSVLERVGDAELVVVVAGVGYRVTVDARGTDVGDIVQLWIHAITGETGTRLYGFETTAERDLFVELLSVKGVGPKTAFAIVSRGVGLVDRSQHDEKETGVGEECQGSEKPPDALGADISHDDLGRRRVPPQEAEDGPEHRRRDDGQLERVDRLVDLGVSKLPEGDDRVGGDDQGR